MKHLARLTDRTIGVCRCDGDFIEVSLPGFWLAEHCEAEDGVFLASFEASVEADLVALWLCAGHALSLTD
jgi:hypothetical protein